MSEIETNFKTYFKIDLDTQMPINALNNHCDFLYHIDVITFFFLSAVPTSSCLAVLVLILTDSSQIFEWHACGAAKLSAAEI